MYNRDMIKLVIFDMDGLLIDSERAMWIVNEKKAGKMVGYDIPEDLLRKIIGGSNDESKKAFLSYFGNDFPIEKFYEYVWKFNNESVENNEVPLCKGAKELLHFLKQNNFKIALGTSSPLDYTKTILTNLEVIHYFDHITTRDDVKRGKPYPDIYQHVFDHYNFTKDEIIVLEDAHNGMLASTAAGLKTILIEDLSILTQEDRNTAVLVGKCLLEVIDYLKETNKLS